MKLKAKAKVADATENKKQTKKTESAAPAKSVKKNNSLDLPDKCGIKDVAKIYAAENEVSQSAAESAIRGTIDAICNALSTGHDVAFVGFFSMSLAQRKAKTGINPRTGEKMEVPAATVVKFKPGAKLKEAVNK